MAQLIKAVIDTQKNSYRSIGQVNAADDLELELEVKMNGQPIEFINPECELLIKKSDNNKVRQTKDIIYKDGKFKIKVDEQGVTYPGIVTCQLLTREDGRVSTCLFYFMVGTSLDREVLQSISKVEVLEELDEYVATAFANLDEYEKRIISADETIRKLNDDMNEAEKIRGASELERQETFKDLKENMNATISNLESSINLSNLNEKERSEVFNSLKSDLESIKQDLNTLNTNITLEEGKRVQAEINRVNKALEIIEKLESTNNSVATAEAERVTVFNDIKSELTSLKEALTTINNTANSNEEVRKENEVGRVAAEQQRQDNFNSMKLENDNFKKGINEQYDNIVTEFDKVIANVTNGNENATNSEIVQARGKEVNLNARLDNFDEQLDNKASKTEIEVERRRIDTFTSLPQGSTTGDAELIDSRIDSSGNIFPNSGRNIRNIDYMLKSIFKHTEIINETITTQSKSLYYNFKIGKYYKISITCPATYSFSFKESGKLNTIISNKTKNTEGLYFYCDKAYTEVITYLNPTSELKLIISELSIDNSNINLLNNIDENSLANLDNVSRIFISRELLNFKFTSSPNTQKCEFKKGVKYKFNVNSNDITYSISLLPSYPSVTGYIPIIPNTNQSKNDFEYIPEQDFTGIIVWNSTPASGTIDVQITTDSIDGKLVYEEIESELKNIYSAYFGDSITSDDVTGIGTRVAEILGCKLTGNFAIGASTCSDFHNNDTNLSEVNLSRPSNTYASINVLSNQVRRCLQYTTAVESQITWNHKLDGSFNIDTTKGVGLGNTDKIPNFIYIAIGTNDGIDSKTEVVDDTSTVFSQTYSQLTRLSLASALRWAIETLQCAYPKAKIFVASPLQTSRTEGNFSYNSNLQKRNIIEKVCQFCSVEFIDSFSRSGYSTFRANDNGDGIHPGADWKERIAQFIANEIRNKYVVNS